MDTFNAIPFDSVIHVYWETSNQIRLWVATHSVVGDCVLIPLKSPYLRLFRLNENNNALSLSAVLYYISLQILWFRKETENVIQLKQTIWTKRIWYGSENQCSISVIHSPPYFLFVCRTNKKGKAKTNTRKYWIKHLSNAKHFCDELIHSLVLFVM